MLRYKYTVLPKTVVTDVEKNLSYNSFNISRTISKQYLDSFDIEKEILSQFDINDIKSHYKNFKEGVFNKPLIAKEEAWYELYKELVITIEALNNPDTSVEDLVSLETTKTDLESKIAEIEVDNIWLLEYTTTAQDTSLNNLSVRPVIEGFIYPKPFLNRLIAYKRDTSVRNAETSIADVAKMNSLLFSMVGMMYNTLTATAKDKIPPQDRAVMEYAIASFKTKETRADRQLVRDGTKLIDKLFKREVDIADIIDEVKK